MSELMYFTYETENQLRTIKGLLSPFSIVQIKCISQMYSSNPGMAGYFSLLYQLMLDFPDWNKLWNFSSTEKDFQDA